MVLVDKEDYMYDNAIEVIDAFGTSKEQLAEWFEFELNKFEECKEELADNYGLTNNGDYESELIYRYMNDKLAISDEEIIKTILHAEKFEYIVNYYSYEDCFKITEIKR